MHTNNKWMHQICDSLSYSPFPAQKILISNVSISLNCYNWKGNYTNIVSISILKRDIFPAKDEEIAIKAQISQLQKTKPLFQTKNEQILQNIYLYSERVKSFYFLFCNNYFYHIYILCDT